MTAGTALADCGITEGRVSIIGNEFPAIRAVADRAAGCATDGVDIRANLTSQHQTLNVAGCPPRRPNTPARSIANSSIVALINDDVIRPLNDLVDAYGQDLPPHTLITIDGDIMAVAFMANAQHLVYPRGCADRSRHRRAHLLRRRAGRRRNDPRERASCNTRWAAPMPRAGTSRREFINMYIGHGRPVLRARVRRGDDQQRRRCRSPRDDGRASTNTLKPDYLTHDSNATSTEWMAGNVALYEHVGLRARRC